MQYTHPIIPFFSGSSQVEIANFLEQKGGGIVEAFEQLREIAPGAVPKVLPPLLPGSAPKPPPPKLQSGEEPWQKCWKILWNDEKTMGKLDNCETSSDNWWNNLGKLMRNLLKKKDGKTLKYLTIEIYGTGYEHMAGAVLVGKRGEHDESPWVRRCCAYWQLNSSIHGT